MTVINFKVYSLIRDESQSLKVKAADPFLQLHIMYYPIKATAKCPGIVLLGVQMCRSRCVSDPLKFLITVKMTVNFNSKNLISDSKFRNHGIRRFHLFGARKHIVTGVIKFLTV